MSLTIRQFDQLPTIGALLGTQGHKELIESLNHELGSTSFFGSDDDPFASQHQYFIQQVVEPIRLIGLQFREQYREIQSPDTNCIRPIMSIEDLEQGIPECMWMPIAMHPVIKEYGRQHRVDLFGMDAKNLPDENVYQRLMDNGEVTLDPKELKKNGDKYEFTVEYRSTDPDLTDDEIYHLKDTYAFIDLFYSKLDEIYESMGASSTLKEKSYLKNGTQLKDLDITSYPNKKG